MKKCTETVYSITKAMAVREALQKNGIKTVLVKTTGREGCVWNIEYDCSKEKEAKRIIGMS